MLRVFRAHEGMIAEKFGLTREQLSYKLGLLESSTSLEELFQRGGIEYIAPGDAGHTNLADKSVDIFYSHAVLEHVPESIAHDLIVEAKRVLKPTGIFYALIGLFDHYSYIDNRVSKVNFLKYSEWLWTLFVKNRISYHNRLRERDFLEILAKYGGVVEKLVSTIDPTDVERVKQMKVAPRFRRFSPEECAVSLTEIIAKFSACDTAISSSAQRTIKTWGE